MPDGVTVSGSDSAYLDPLSATFARASTSRCRATVARRGSKLPPGRRSAPPPAC